MYHFWYSPKLAELHAFEGDEPNKCKISVDSQVAEVEYTHCHHTFIKDGGVAWGDVVYLGEGQISYIGKHPSMDRIGRGGWEAMESLIRSIEYAKRLKIELAMAGSAGGFMFQVDSAVYRHESGFGVTLVFIFYNKTEKVTTKVDMSDEEAKHLGLELYRLSDGGDLQKDLTNPIKNL